MEWFSIFILVAIWTAAIVSAVTGIIWNPNMYIRREDHPRDFWKAYSVVFFFSVVVTVMIFLTSEFGFQITG